MKSHSKPLLLAGTRLTGDTPHLGTYYGWIKQIRDASEIMDVCIVISDFQSLSGNMEYRELSNNLKKNLIKYIPSKIPIIIESDLYNISTLGILSSKLFSKSQLNRFSSFKKLKKSKKMISYNDYLYPSMMIANILAIGATHVFDKPESKFQPHQVLNDALLNANKYYGWPTLKVDTYQKKMIDIPSLDGSGPMQRSREKNGLIEVNSTDTRTIFSKLISSKYPSKSLINIERQSSCNVISSVWRSVDATRILSCGNTKYPCEKCIYDLSNKIFSDINELNVDLQTRKIIEDKVILDAKTRINELINTALEGENEDE